VSSQISHIGFEVFSNMLSLQKVRKLYSLSSKQTHYLF